MTSSIYKGFLYKERIRGRATEKHTTRVKSKRSNTVKENEERRMTKNMFV